MFRKQQRNKANKKYSLCNTLIFSVVFILLHCILLGVLFSLLDFHSINVSVNAADAFDSKRENVLTQSSCTLNPPYCHIFAIFSQNSVNGCKQFSQNFTVFIVFFILSHKVMPSLSLLYFVVILFSILLLEKNRKRRHFSCRNKQKVIQS